VTIQRSILVGAVIIGGSIILSRLATPSNGQRPRVYLEANRITGEVRECLRGMNEREQHIVSDCK
jgi:hypothetical protein